MKFRNTPVDGFFALHIATGEPLTEAIKEELEKDNAVMEDVQYSTHIEDGVLFNDVLVMYRKQDKPEDWRDAIKEAAYEMH